MKNVYVIPPQSRFPLKLIYCIAFGSASMFLNYFLSIDQKNFLHQLQHCNLLFLQMEEILLVTFSSQTLSLNYKTKSLLIPGKLGSIKNSKFLFSICCVSSG